MLPPGARANNVLKLPVVIDWLITTVLLPAAAVTYTQYWKLPGVTELIFPLLTLYCTVLKVGAPPELNCEQFTFCGVIWLT